VWFVLLLPMVVMLHIMLMTCSTVHVQSTLHARICKPLLSASFCVDTTTTTPAMKRGFAAAQLQLSVPILHVPTLH
jgi:hypothetical protein